MESPQPKHPLAGGSLEAWQPDALAARFGDRLFRVTKPFFSGGTPLLPLNEDCVSVVQANQQGMGKDVMPVFVRRREQTRRVVRTVWALATASRLLGS